MLFKNDEVEFQYSIRGTCFLIKFHERIYALTAKHNIKDFHPRQFRVPARLGDQAMLNYSQPFTIEMHNEDFEDFVAFEIPLNTNQLNGFLQDDAAATFDRAIDWRKVQKVSVCGFPTELNEFYESERISYQSVCLLASCTGKSVIEGCYEIEIDQPIPLKSLDGLSGSPVFCRDPSCPILLGMILRGSPNTLGVTKLHFLDIRLVLRSIEYIETQNKE